MNNIKNRLEYNARLLKSNVSKYAIYGLLISILAIVIASLASSYQLTGKVSLAGILYSHKNNIALMILDFTPFIFMIWGQSISSVISYKAGAMIIDQTQALVEETKKITTKAEFEASHDLLTNLPNRSLFIEKIKHGIANLKNKSGQLAVVILDIENFKELNAGFGNSHSDDLLKKFAHRLKLVFSEPSIIARISDDEFAILLHHTESKEELISYLKKVHQSLLMSFTIDSMCFDVIARMGVAIYPENGQFEDTLLQRANVALQDAKDYRKPVSIYEASMDKDSTNRVILISELKHAIESQQLRIRFQPQINLSSNSIESCEALVCWQHPTFGLIISEKFISTAERTDLAKDITDFVLKTSIKNASEWYKQGRKIGVSVNLFAIDMLNAQLPKMIDGLLRQYNLPPSMLTIELGESYPLSNNDRTKIITQEIASLGVNIAIDAFGTGVAFLKILSTFPVKMLKIDRSFISLIEKNEKIQSITKAVIAMGKILDIAVVAVGIENKKQLDLVKSLGCISGQGNYLSPPLESKNFADWLMRPNEFLKGQQATVKAVSPSKKIN